MDIEPVELSTILAHVCWIARGPIVLAIERSPHMLREDNKPKPVALLLVAEVARLSAIERPSPWLTLPENNIL